MYTKQQIAIMEKCRGGMRWVFHQRGQMLEDDLMRSLIAEGLVQARCDIGDDIYCLTYKGEALLEERERVTHQIDPAEVVEQKEHRKPKTDITDKVIKLGKISGAVAAVVELIAALLARFPH